MPVIGPSIPMYDWCPGAQPSVVGVLVTGATVKIELWKNGVAVTVTSDACTEIGTTGKYTWSIGNLAILSKTLEQYSWRMTADSGETDEGDFILKSPYGILDMPSLTNPSGYIVNNW